MTVSSTIAFALKQGKSVAIEDAPTSGWMRFIEDNGEFFGVGEVSVDGRIAPKRLVGQQ